MEKSVALFYYENISKNVEKVFKNLLTNRKKCVIIRHTRKGKRKNEVSKMKTFMVSFVKEGQEEKQTVLVSAKDYTDAYFQVYFEIPKDASITDLFEVI